MSNLDGGSEHQKLVEPTSSTWTELGLSPVSEVHAGHQSRVFLASGRSGQLIVKFIEAREGHTFIRNRVELNAKLAQINPTVVGPIALKSGLVTDIDLWHVVCYPFIEGTTPDISNRDDVEAMAATLAALHGSLATLSDAELPPVLALQQTTDDRLRHGQIIHGDYASANLINTPAGLRVIDFADCGYGSVEFEIGNSLYMVLFDAWHTGGLHRYERFRSWFVDAYRTAASNDLDQEPLDEALLDEAIQVRVKALSSWLTDLSQAPNGIRTASPEWREYLRLFVAEATP